MARYKIVLISLVVIGATLRWFHLTESMSFLYDQGRDALAAQKILSGHLVLVGPTTDMPGLFFGPMWYYLLAGLYAMSFGNPAVVTFLLSFLDLATIVLFYIVGNKIFNRTAGLLAAFFWAVGSLPVAYSRTLANPSTSAFWSILVFYFLFQSQPFLAIAATALLFQFNAAGAFLLLPFIIITLFLSWPRVKNKSAYFFGLIFLGLTFLPQITFEVRHSFLGTKTILKIFSVSGGGNYLQGLWQRFQNLWQELSDYTFFNQKNISLFAATISLFVILKSKGKNLFLFWFVIPLATFLFLYPRGESHPFYLLSWIPAAILALAYLLSQIWHKSRFLVALVIFIFLYFNLSGLKREIVLKDHFAQPADPIKAGLADQENVLDYIYVDAKDNRTYGYYAYNVTPYWADENWRYLFSWYGKNKYGYLPLRQAGSPLYIIYEPEPYLGQHFQDEWLAKMHSPANGKIVSSKKIGEYTIEKISK